MATRGHETCRGVLKDKYVRSPRTPKAWKSIAKNFQEIWNLSHCIGAIDGKHVAIKSLNSGSSYFDYKGYFSIILMAICDANIMISRTMRLVVTILIMTVVYLEIQKWENSFQK